jgi:hypothetical protein
MVAKTTAPVYCTTKPTEEKHPVGMSKLRNKLKNTGLNSKADLRGPMVKDQLEVGNVPVRGGFEATLKTGKNGGTTGFWKCGAKNALRAGIGGDWKKCVITLNL